MRAQCCICSDLFENSDTVNIAAAPCGHTFHEACLMKWLASSGTCPSCRKVCKKSLVIKRLFFDIDAGDDVSEQSPTKLTNQVGDLKAKVRQFERDKSDLLERQTSLQSQIQSFQIESDIVENKLKKEKNLNISLKKEVSNYEAQQRYFKNEQEQYRKSLRNLKELQHLEVLLTGCESDATEILNQNGEGSSKQLSRYCAVLKREYEQTKQDKKSYKDQIDKLRRELVSKERQLNDRNKETSILTEQLTRSEEDLKNVEKEKEALRKKLSRLKKGFHSPASAASASFIDTLTEESPSGCVAMAMTPVRDSKSVKPDVPLTPDLFDTPNTQTKRECDENQMKHVKISSARGSQPSLKRPRTESSDPNDLRILGSLNIFKKKCGLESFPSAIRKGYDGFGGHTTFTNNLGSKNRVQASKNRTVPSRKFLAKQPKLPSLDSFIEID